MTTRAKDFSSLWEDQASGGRAPCKVWGGTQTWISVFAGLLQLWAIPWAPETLCLPLGSHLALARFPGSLVLAPFGPEADTDTSVRSQSHCPQPLHSPGVARLPQNSWGRECYPETKQKPHTTGEVAEGPLRGGVCVCPVLCQPGGPAPREAGDPGSSDRGVPTVRSADGSCPCLSDSAPTSVLALNHSQSLPKMLGWEAAGPELGGRSLGCASSVACDRHRAAPVTPPLPSGPRAPGRHESGHVPTPHAGPEKDPGTD